MMVRIASFMAVALILNGCNKWGSQQSEALQDYTEMATVEVISTKVAGNPIRLIGILAGEASCLGGTAKYMGIKFKIDVPVSVTKIGICGMPGGGKDGGFDYVHIDVAGKLKAGKTLLIKDDKVQEEVDSGLVKVVVESHTVKGNQVTLIGIINQEAACQGGNPKFRSNTSEILVSPEVTKIGICGMPGSGPQGGQDWRIVDVKGKLKLGSTTIIRDDKVVD
jgi:hypothetical protein